jgi:hypothetical protein
MTKRPSWISNDPNAVKVLKAADRAYEKSRADAAGIPLAEKIEAYRVARCVRQAAYNDLMAVAPDMTAIDFVTASRANTTGKENAMNDPDSANDQGPPTAAEVEAISRELMEAQGAAMAPGRRDLLQRAAVMIARLERAWLEASGQRDRS